MNRSIAALALSRKLHQEEQAIDSFIRFLAVERGFRKLSTLYPIDRSASFAEWCAAKKKLDESSHA